MHGYRCLILPTNYDLNHEINEIKNLLNGGADGIIMCYQSDDTSDDYVHKLIISKDPIDFC